MEVCEIFGMRGEELISVRVMRHDMGEGCQAKQDGSFL